MAPKRYTQQGQELIVSAVRMLASVSQTHSQWRRQKRPKQPQLALGTSVLSPRELQVMKCRKEGLRYKEIGPKLGISVHTAKHHAARAFEKLAVTTSLEAVALLFIL